MARTRGFAPDGALLAVAAIVVVAVAAVSSGEADAGVGADDTIGIVATEPGDEPVEPRVVDELRDGDVLRIRVAGLEAHARGRVWQCADVDRRRGCGNSFPVQTDARGVAFLQYQVRVEPGTCGGAEACGVVVDDGSREALLYTVFGEPAPSAPRVTVTPGGPYEVGARVDVTVESVPAGSLVEVAYCDPVCEEGARVEAGTDGTARATALISSRCERGELCRIRVKSVGARVATAPVSFVPEPDVRYDTRRLATGISIAALLVALATWIARRTDWRGPGEAATPELDRAEL